jgi:arginine-tRNA-protein transferase
LLFGNDLIDSHGYVQFLVESCVDSIEFSYRLNGKLLGVAVADRAADALSAVYCYYDPRYSRFSPGVYSILKQIELCRQWGLRYLYLGLYVAGSHSMEYKSRYLPHERLVSGAWRRIER